MKILCVSGYPAWEKVSRLEMPSHHLFGIHEMIDHYEPYGDSIRGILKRDLYDGGYVDFYLWKDGKQNIFKQAMQLRKMSKEYDVIYDMLNRCSIYLGFFKRCGMMRTKLITYLHHPPYDIQLKIADSDAYEFINADYREIAIKAYPQKEDRFFVNEWYPDIEWYKKICVNAGQIVIKNDEAFYIDNGKSRRDRDLLIQAAECSRIRVDYAGQEEGSVGYARPYKMNLSDDIGMMKRLLRYKAIVVPIEKSDKGKIGPLGTTSFLDCIALAMPVIASDNVCFAGEVEKNKLGLVYKTGDLESLVAALMRLKDDSDFYEECVENLKLYAKHTMKDYSEKLIEIINKVV